MALVRVTRQALEPAPGQPGSDQLPFMAAFGNPRLTTCRCRRGHGAACLARRAEAGRARELADALQPEDIRWLNGHGWDGRFG
jgi:hypothetical protein